MREIKFKIVYQHEETGRIAERLISIGDSIPDIGPRWFIIAKHQYTGLKDKNGVEIYDGDVLQRDEYDTPDESMYYEKCIVVWDESAWKVKFYDDILLICDYKPDTGWVIGNIYENPELLSGEKRKEEKEK